MTKIITVDWLKQKNACSEAVEKYAPMLNGGKPLSECVDKLDRADWLLWLLWHSGAVNTRQSVWLACICGRFSLRHVQKGEDRPRLAYEAAEAWVKDPSKAASSASWAASSASRESENKKMCDTGRASQAQFQGPGMASQIDALPRRLLRIPSLSMRMRGLQESERA